MRRRTRRARRRGRAIDVAVALRQVAVDVVRAEQDLQRAAAPDQARQPGHRAAAGHQAGADLPLRQDRLLPAGEAHVAGERELAADAGRPPANRRDRDDRRAAQPHEHVGQRLQAGRARRQARRVLGLGEEVVVRQEEAVDGAVEDDDLDVLVGLERRDDLVELRNRFRAEDVQGRMIERHAPIGWRAPLEPDLLIGHACLR